MQVIVLVLKEQFNTAEKTIKESGGIRYYSLGPIVHNPQVVEKFNNEGLTVIENIDEYKEGKIIIRSHGIPLKLQRKIQDLNLELIDCTCPYVKSVHNKVERIHSKGYKIVIIGDKNHPEVIGINGWCNNEAIIINNEEEARI